MRLRLEYRPEPFHSPVSHWAHKAPPKTYFHRTPRNQLTPPMPPLELGKGYPVWVLENRGHEIFFASPEEIAVVIDALSKRVMPRSIDLGRSGSLNSHWLSRLHKSWKPWRTRQRAVALLAPHAAKRSS